VTWKFAATLDGRSAAADGTSQWITSEPARADVHALRGTVDAIIVGVGTVLADDPHLTVRDPRDGSLAIAQPLRVVVDSAGRTPETPGSATPPHRPGSRRRTRSVPARTAASTCRRC
jgi:diaminohydroxyphosphoribosylaminopyrimidine deaminase/5-amino-6-(5-phosphoribosylamino)uracil reductase